MGLADRDYMRNPTPPRPPVGGRLVAVLFILVLAALLLFGLPGRSRFYRKHIAKPIGHFMKNLQSPRSYHKRKHRR